LIDLLINYITGNYGLFVVINVDSQPTIREAGVAALRAALVITSLREGKQKENPAYYKVVSALFLHFCSIMK